MAKKKYTTQEILLIIHSPNVRVRSTDWDETEYIEYNPEHGVIDENEDTVNASVFVLNNEWEVVGGEYHA